MNVVCRRAWAGVAVLLAWMSLGACSRSLVPVPKPRCSTDADCDSTRHVCDSTTKRCVDKPAEVAAATCAFKNPMPVVLDDLSSLAVPPPGESPREFPGPLLVYRQTSTIIRVAAQHGHDGPVRVWTGDVSRQQPDFSQFVDKDIGGDLVNGAARGPSVSLLVAHATMVPLETSSSSAAGSSSASQGSSAPAPSSAASSSGGGASSQPDSSSATPAMREGYMLQRLIIPTGDRIASADEIVAEDLTEPGLAWDEAEIGALGMFGTGGDLTTVFAATVEERPVGHEYYWVVTGRRGATPVPVRSTRAVTESDGNAEASRAAGIARTADATHVFVRSEVGQTRAYVVTVPDDEGLPVGTPNYMGIPEADSSFIIAVHGDQDGTAADVAIGWQAGTTYSVWAGRVPAARLALLDVHQDLKRVTEVASQAWHTLPTGAPLGSATWTPDSRDATRKDLTWVGRPLLENTQDPGLAFWWVSTEGKVAAAVEVLADRTAVEKAAVVLRDKVADNTRATFDLVWTETVTPAGLPSYQVLYFNELVCSR